MKIAKRMVKVSMGGTECSVDSRVLKLFEAKALDKKTSLLTLAGEYLKEGKSAERALADALEVFRLT